MEKINYDKMAAENRRITLEIAKDYGRIRIKQAEAAKRSEHIHSDLQEMKAIFTAFLLKVGGIEDLQKLTGTPQAP